MDPKHTTKDTKNTQTPAEVHTSAEDAKKAEEIARQERIQDNEAEKHAHKEANIVKQELGNQNQKKA